MPTLTQDDRIFVLHLGDGENRFSPEWLATVNSHLDTVTAGSTPAALVTVGDDKFYSNGLDLEQLTRYGEEEAVGYIEAVQALLARVLVLPVPTIAAVNGHAFGAGAMLAIAHDFRVMRADRGYFCFPEADINIPFTPGMAALVQSKLTPAAAVASMTTGRRFGGPDARDLGLVDSTADKATLLDAAVDVVSPLAGKDRGTLGAIKATMFAPALAALRDVG